MLKSLKDSIIDGDYEKVVSALDDIEIPLFNPLHGNFHSIVRGLNESLLLSTEKENSEIITLIEQFIIKKLGKNHVLNSVKFGCLEIVKILFYRVNIKTRNRMLCTGALHGHLDIVIFLLKMGVKVNINKGEPLYRSAEHGNLEIVSLLIKNGANVHANHNKALYLSSFNNYPEIMVLLIKNGAKIRVKNNTVLKQVLRRNNEEMVNYLFTFYRKHELKYLLKGELSELVISFIIKRDLSKYDKFVTVYRELGIDLFDLIENEK